MSSQPLQLPQRALADTGLSLSSAGLGTVKFGRTQGMKYPSSYTLPTDETLSSLLDLAQDFGVNWLDTAPAYGESEERLGRLIKSRHDWIIATKTGEEFENNCSTFDFSARHTTFSVERSLKRLNTDYLDVVMVHSDGNDEEILQHSDCWEALLKMKQEGKIRAIGMSSKTVAGALKALDVVDVLMLTYNKEYTDEGMVIDAAHARNKATVIKKGFGSGHLMQKYSLDSLCEFVFARPVTSFIVGTINPQHLRDNLEAIARASRL